MADGHTPTPTPPPSPPAPGQEADEVNPDPELDLGTPAGVRAYLAHTAFAGAGVAPLTGGSGNYVYRLQLVGGAYGGKDTLVLKHAKAYAKSFPDMEFDLARQVCEVEALKRVHTWLPGEAVVTVPEVLLFDEKSHVIIMEDAGVDSVDLKTFMKTCGPSRALTAHIGDAVGAFLGALHTWGRNKDICTAMEGNKQARPLTARAYYGRLVPTLTGEDAPEKLKDPPLVVAAADLDVVRRVAAETTRAWLAVDDTFIMGDFWPGNLMVRLDAQGNLERIYVVDWELARAGLHGSEIGQFCAEIYMLGRCYPDRCGETAPALLDHFFQEYRAACAPDDVVARDTLIRWGTHMVVLGPRVDWGSKEISREIVVEGLQFIVDGSESSSLADSVVRGLLV